MTRAATSPSRRSRLQPRIESRLLQKLDALFAPARRKLTGPAVPRSRRSTNRSRSACESCAEVLRLEPVERLGDGHDLAVLLSGSRAARCRWDKAANPLAAKLEVVLTVFQQDHAAAMVRCAKFLETERLWLQNVKLRIPNDYTPPIPR